ncbi:MAG: peptidoglycan editing factor PgeF [Rhizobiaceae bacterium]
MNTLTPILAPELSGKSNVRHAYFTRPGGVSTGVYAGLNARLGSGDKLEHVKENRRLIAEHLNVAEDHLASPYQVHSPDVVVATAPWPEERPKADGIVTNEPNIAIGILTADCGPVLFADQEAGVIGAAHAGWKGAVGGVLENTVLEMEKLGAKRKNITAILGPSISQKNYEVGPDFPALFLQQSSKNSRFFIPSKKPNHYMFDLSTYIVERLNQLNLEGGAVNRCTYAEEDNFYSYRRATHQGVSQYGCQLSAIVLSG